MKNDSLFFALLKQAGLPIPTAEVKFLPDRKFRFDYAWDYDKAYFCEKCKRDKIVRVKVALEVEGGVWTGGRHTSGVGFMRDMEKYNLAVVNGWKLLRTTPKLLLSEELIELLQKVL